MILGRPDNSIKNYWNSILRHKRGELCQNLEKYLSSCIELDRPDDASFARKDIQKRLLRYFIHQAQKQYLDHLSSKRQDVNYEKESPANTKLRTFKLKLLGRALTLHQTEILQDE